MFVDRTTATAGQRITLLQQLIGNIGQFKAHPTRQPAAAREQAHPNLRGVALTGQSGQQQDRHDDDFDHVTAGPAVSL